MEPTNPFAPPATVFPTDVAAARPVTFTEVLVSGTKLYVARFPAILAIVALVWGPLELLLSYAEYFVLDPQDVRSTLGTQLLAQNLAGLIVLAGVVQVGASTLLGQPLSWSSALMKGLSAWPRLFVTNLLEGILLGLALLALVVPFFYFAVRFSLTETVTIFERKIGTKALRRSMDLTHGKFLWFLGLCMVTAVPLTGLSFVAYIPIEFLPLNNQWLASAAVSFLLDLLVQWSTIVFVTAYVSVNDSDGQIDGPTAPHTDGTTTRKVLVRW